MAKIDLNPDEALVLIDFLLRFRDDERLSIEHNAEERVLWDLAALLESQVPELLDAGYRDKLQKARAAVSSGDLE